MKPSEKQIELSKEIINQVKFWITTNDINSPTHLSDIGEEIEAFFYNNDIDYNEKEIEGLVYHLQEVFRFVRQHK